MVNVTFNFTDASLTALYSKIVIQPALGVIAYSSSLVTDMGITLTNKGVPVTVALVPNTYNVRCVGFNSTSNFLIAIPSNAEGTTVNAKDHLISAIPSANYNAATASYALFSNSSSYAYSASYAPSPFTDIYNAPNSGLVGIYNSNPQYTLDVNGGINCSTLHLNGNIITDGYVLWDAANNTAAIKYTDEHLLNDLEGNLMVNFSGGVGQDLLIASNTTLDGNLNVTGNISNNTGDMSLITSAGSLTIGQIANDTSTIIFDVATANIVFDTTGLTVINSNFTTNANTTFESGFASSADSTVTGKITATSTVQGSDLKLKYDAATSFRIFPVSNGLTLNAGTNYNLTVQPKISLTDGIAFASINDANSANLGMEFRASKYMFWSNNVGIGVSPSYKLDVSGDINLTGALRVATSAGTSGQVLSSTGTGLSWITPVSATSTTTFTNKRISPRVNNASVFSGGSPIMATDSFDLYVVTAQNANTTSISASGTPVDGQEFGIAMTGTGTFTVGWDSAKFESSGTLTLPTTVTSTRRDLRFVWNTTTSKWRLVLSA